MALEVKGQGQCLQNHHRTCSCQAISISDQ